MPLFFSFRGSISRSEYWIGLGVIIICQISLGKIAGESLPSAVWVLISCLSTWCFLAVCVKRLRDMGKHWAWCLILFLPFANLLLMLVMGIMEGD